MEYIFGHRVTLRINSNYFPKQSQPTVFAVGPCCAFVTNYVNSHTVAMLSALEGYVPVSSHVCAADM
jgi:hypothetical protein